MAAETKSTLMNPDALAIDQDWDAKTAPWSTDFASTARTTCGSISHAREPLVPVAGTADGRQRPASAGSPSLGRARGLPRRLPPIRAIGVVVRHSTRRPGIRMREISL
jgi:hypothetical protein